jgi:hypothetical protein
MPGPETNIKRQAIRYDCLPSLLGDNKRSEIVYGEEKILCPVLSRLEQTRLDLHNSELALASSPVLFWNLCAQSEIWISIVICGLAAVVGQAIKAPPLSS